MGIISSGYFNHYDYERKGQSYFIKLTTRDCTGTMDSRVKKRTGTC